MPGALLLVDCHGVTKHDDTVQFGVKCREQDRSLSHKISFRRGLPVAKCLVCAMPESLTQPFRCRIYREIIGVNCPSREMHRSDCKRNNLPWFVVICAGKLL